MGLFLDSLQMKKNEMVELQPISTIAFSAPWNGEYDT
jgi:hypothetical protein